MAETWIDQGGYLSNTELSKKFQTTAQPLMKFRQFVSWKDERLSKKHAGQSVNWLKVSNLGTFGGALVETNTMPETTQAKAWGTMSVGEYGNSLPFTFKVTTLSKFDLEKIVEEGLRNDMVKVMDGLTERQFNATLLRYVGTTTAGFALTTSGTATATNTSILNTYHVRKMILELQKRNVAGWSESGGDFAFIGSHECIESLQGALESVYQYTEAGMKRNFNGEVGKYFNCRFISDGFATRFVYDATAKTATAITWSGGQSGVGYMFGSPTVMEATVVGEEIRAKEISDYGRSHGLAWYYLGGFKIIWDTSGGADSRIIKWDSAA